MSSSKKNIKGITIELGGNIQPLSRALESADKQSRDLASELKQVEKLLKFDPSNTVLLAQKQQILSGQVENTADKLKILKNAQEQVERQFRSGEIDEGKYRAFQREVEDTEIALNSARKQLDKFGQSAKVSAGNIDDAKDKIEELTDKTAAGAKAAMGAVVSLTAGLLGLGAAYLSTAESSREFTSDMSRLEQNAADSGSNLSMMKNELRELYALTGETDSSIEALSNIMATGFNDTQAAEAIEALSGAVVKFPDTLKIESLSDSLQETIASGSAAGQFSELISRCGDDVEKFNERLEACSTTAQRQQLVLNWLNKSGLAETAAAYKVSNAAALDYARSSFDVEAAMAEIGKTATPLASSLNSTTASIIKSGLPTLKKLGGQFNEYAKKYLPQIEKSADKLIRRLGKIDADDIADDVERIGTGLKIAAPLVSTFVSAFAGYKTVTSASKAIGTVKDAVKGLGVVMSANPATMFITAAAAVVGLGTALYGLAKAADDSEEIINEVFSEMDGANITAVADAFGDAVDDVAHYARQVNDLGEAVDSSDEAFDSAAKSAEYYLTKIAAAGKISREDAEGIIQAFRDMAANLEISLSNTSEVIYTSLVGALQQANTDAPEEINDYIRTVHGVQAALDNEISQIETELEEYSEKISAGIMTDTDFSAMQELLNRMSALQGNISETQTSWNMLRDDIANGNLSFGSKTEVETALDNISSKATAAIDDINAAETKTLNAIENTIASVNVMETLSDEQKNQYIAQLEEMRELTRESYEEQRQEIVEQQSILLNEMYTAAITAKNQAIAKAEPTFSDEWLALQDGTGTMTGLSIAQSRVGAEYNKIIAPIEEAAAASGIQIGSGIAEGTAIGIGSGASEVSGAAKEMLRNCTKIDKSEFFSLGEDIASGVAGGISSGIGMVSSAARNVANQARIAMQEALDIHSPSRVMRKLGHFSTEGYALGLTDKIRDIEAATARVVNATTAPVSSTVNNSRSFSATINNTFQNATKWDAQVIVSELNRLLGDLL